MRRVLNTLVGRLALLQLLIYALLLPVLFSGLDAVVRANAVNTFTRYARAYTGALARELELGAVLESPSRTVIFLDGSVEGGGCVYAAMELNGRLIGSSVTETPAWVRSRGDDVEFAKTAGNIYAVALPIRRGDAVGQLYLGFDKRPTLERLRATRRQIIEALAAYAIASVFVALFLARVVSRPLTQLQAVSRRIARGETATQLGTDSKMVEIVELSRDLEIMRRELVDIAGRLRHEQRLATIGTLAGGLAHEFNNILVPLILYTEEALDEIDMEHPARANLDRVLRAANRASDVIAKLMAFSRPVPERPPGPVNLAAVTHEALELCQALMPANIELRREIGLAEGFVLGDPTLLNQVVLNLCTNAVQAMRERGGTLTVKVAAPNAADGPPTLELRVKDTGHGMEPQVQERIFEPYFTTREVGEGSGLGLSIVHGIVASMGGTISVVSALDEGTEFIVQFPGLSRRGDANSARD